MRSAEFKDVRRWLVIMPSWVGDAAMATPCLRAMRRAFPQATFVGYMRPGLDEVMAGAGWFDEMRVGRPSGLFGPARESQALADAGADAALLLPNSFRLALTAFLAGVPRRVGYGRDWRSPLLTHAIGCPVPGGWREPIPAVDYYLHLAAEVGAATDDRRLELGATEAQREAAATILERVGVGEYEPVAILNPGANREDKRWPAERFAVLGDRLCERHGMRVLVNGSPAERELVGRIVSAMSAPAVDLPSLGVTLGSLKALCARARLVVTNDTGTRHLAVAMAASANRPAGSARTAVVTLFGPTAPEWTTLGYEREVEVRAPGGRMERLNVDAVAAACDDLLSS